MKTKRAATNSLLVACCFVAISVIAYAQRPGVSRGTDTHLTKIELASRGAESGAQETPARQLDAVQAQKIVRDVYVRLMRYHTAARDEQAATTDVSYKPDDYVVFELRDMHTGPIEEIAARPLEELVSSGTGEVLNVTPHHLQFGNGAKHAYYDVEWGANSSPSIYNEKTTVKELLGKVVDSLGEVDWYTSYQVTARLAGGVRTYRAIALHCGQLDSSGKVRTEILDNITTEMNAVLADALPRVRSPWKTYVKSGLYLAIAKQISKIERAGKPLIPADAPIGYLPGDDVIPNGRDAQMGTLLTCSAPPTISGPVTLWWFNYYSPAGYATQITLTASPAGAGSYQWTVVAGRDFVNFSNDADDITTSANQVVLKSTGQSVNLYDIKIRVGVNGVQSLDFSVVSRAPYSLLYVSEEHSVGTGGRAFQFPIDYPLSDPGSIRYGPSFECTYK